MRGADGQQGRLRVGKKHQRSAPARLTAKAKDAEAGIPIIVMPSTNSWEPSHPAVRRTPARRAAGPWPVPCSTREEPIRSGPLSVGHHELAPLILAKNHEQGARAKDRMRGSQQQMAAIKLSSWDRCRICNKSERCSRFAVKNLPISDGRSHCSLPQNLTGPTSRGRETFDQSQSALRLARSFIHLRWSGT